MRTVFVNDHYCPEDEAKISIFDRGFLFADGIYEVTSVIESKLVDINAHLKRLHRSLSALDIPCPLSEQALVDIHTQLIQKNNLREGLIYLQISRGPAERDFAFPKDPQPTIIAFTQERAILDNPKVEAGLKVLTLPDIRWQRRDIKTIGLLPASMAKQQAIQQGADDAWMIDDNGYVTEGTSNNCFIVSQGKIITRPLNNEILHGITRRALLKIAEEQTIPLEERPFSKEEAYQAEEAFISSAATFCLPVVQIDNKTVSNGQPGPVFKALREAYITLAKLS